MNKLIGLCASLNMYNYRQECDLQYIDSIINVGLSPVILPYRLSKEQIKYYLSKLSGIVLCGGNDIDPKYYGEEKHEKLGKLTVERDVLEFAVFKEAMSMNMPVLGICRGFQLINVALGGSLIQDIASEYGTMVIHSIPSDEVEAYKKRHDIVVVENTPADEWFSGQNQNVNTYHHQGVKKLGKGLIVSSKAKDGIIESFYSNEYKNLIAVQWHPEREGNVAAERLFKSFAKMCEAYEIEKTK